MASCLKQSIKLDATFLEIIQLLPTDCFMLKFTSFFSSCGHFIYLQWLIHHVHYIFILLIMIQWGMQLVSKNIVEILESSLFWCQYVLEFICKALSKNLMYLNYLRTQKETLDLYMYQIHFSIIFLIVELLYYNTLYWVAIWLFGSYLVCFIIFWLLNDTGFLLIRLLDIMILMRLKA